MFHLNQKGVLKIDSLMMYLSSHLLQLLEGEVYHYHTKLMMKEAHTGGSFVWHQDYG